jgi:hypothetical protein
MLLVLDNCEHVIEAAAALAVDSLRGARGVRVLASLRSVKIGRNSACDRVCSSPRRRLMEFRGSLIASTRPNAVADERPTHGPAKTSHDECRARLELWLAY